jgi:hypothetical protein
MKERMKKIFVWFILFGMYVHAADGARAGDNSDADSIPSLDCEAWELLRAGRKRARDESIAQERQRKLALRRANYRMHQDLKSDKELKQDREKFSKQNAARYAALTPVEKEIKRIEELARVAALPKEVRQQKWQERKARDDERFAALGAEEQECILEARRARRRELYAMRKLMDRQKKHRRK